MSHARSLRTRPAAEARPSLVRTLRALLLVPAGLLLSFPASLASAGDGVVSVHVSTQDGSRRLERMPDISWGPKSLALMPAITMEESRTFQTMLGMGSSLEPTTCFNLSRLSPEAREEVVERLVHPERGIGMNLMRICIGTPDFTGDPWYSYCDLPEGETDPELRRFSIERDRAYILPAIRLALAKNPDLLFVASPWSPPGWMKSTGTMIGGRLLPEWRPAYAEYFVKFIQAYEAEGLPIHAITVQNEPGVDRSLEIDPKWHYPSCRWTGEEERDFVRDHLGPALERAGLSTRIWCYDHNYNERPIPGDPGIAYPRAILSDPGARSFVDGVAFHGYAGKVEGMSILHAEFPDVPLHFTEGSVFGLIGARQLIDRFRNHASSYNAWVTMIDTEGKPNNGPFEADRTIVMLDPADLSVEYRFDYFLYGQFMKFVKRGAVRIASESSVGALANVAFRNPDGGRVLVVVNPGGEPRRVQTIRGEERFEAELAASSVTTFLWND